MSLPERKLRYHAFPATDSAPLPVHRIHINTKTSRFFQKLRIPQHAAEGAAQYIHEFRRRSFSHDEGTPHRQGYRCDLPLASMFLCLQEFENQRRC